MNLSNIKVKTEFLGLFCDDVREEASGQFTLVGCYNCDLLKNEFPAVVPNLWIAIRAKLPIDKEIKDIKVVIQRNEETLLEEIIKAEVSNDIEAKQSENLDKPTAFINDIAIPIPPFYTTSESTLRVIAEYEGELFIVSKLNIRKKP